MQAMLARLLVVGLLSISCYARVITEGVTDGDTPGEAIPVNNQWKVDVIETLDTLKEVLTTFEKKWDEVPLELENGTFTIKEGNTTITENDSQLLELSTTTDSLIAEITARNEFSERMPIIEDPSKRVQGDQIFGCPHSWPHHDAYPVMEPICGADTDCADGELCCQLFHNNYCFKALDATPKPGQCRFTKFNFLDALHCMVDDPGCKYDSECSEPSWKCCDGPCRYKECLPSTLSLSPSDIKRQQERLHDSASPPISPIPRGLPTVENIPEEIPMTQEVAAEDIAHNAAAEEIHATTGDELTNNLQVVPAALIPATEDGPTIQRIEEGVENTVHVVDRTTQDAAVEEVLIQQQAAVDIAPTQHAERQVNDVADQEEIPARHSTNRELPAVVAPPQPVSGADQQTVQQHRLTDEQHVPDVVVKAQQEVQQQTRGQARNRHQTSQMPTEQQQQPQQVEHIPVTRPNNRQQQRNQRPQERGRQGNNRSQNEQQQTPQQVEHGGIQQLESAVGNLSQQPLDNSLLDIGSENYSEGLPLESWRAVLQGRTESPLLEPLHELEPLQQLLSESSERFIMPQSAENNGLPQNTPHSGSVLDRSSAIDFDRFGDSFGSMENVNNQATNTNTDISDEFTDFFSFRFAGMDNTNFEDGQF